MDIEQAYCFAYVCTADKALAEKVSCSVDILLLMPLPKVPHCEEQGHTALQWVVRNC